MSNEEQIADTIEMLYERLNSYNKQDLFNYGYLLESNQILCKDIEEKDKEIEILNNIIDDLEKWLNSEMKRIEDIKNPKHSTTFAPKPYGREREYYDIMINSYKYCLDKLQELKEGK